jgi:carboxymethylenebutenolidase
MDPVKRFLADEATKDFQTGLVTRHEYLRRVALITGGAVVALSLVGALACGGAASTAPAAPVAVATPTPTPTPEPTPTPTPGPGETVAPHDPRIEAGPVQFQAAGATILGYLSRPAAPGPHAAMLVIHENRGILPHFPDVTRRLATEGYVTLTIDLVSREGGTATLGADGARTALREIPQDQFLADMKAAVDYLQDLPTILGDRIGVIGFCFGGGMVWLLAASNPEIRAAVLFYGRAPDLEAMASLNASVLGIFGAEDSRINAGAPDLEAALKQHGKDYKFVTYEGASHAFFNDTGRRYHPEAAEGAWQETLAFLGEQLKG